MKKFERLSPRENEVTRLLLEGKSNKQIAFALGVSIRTVEFHLRNIFAKLEVGSRVELILKLGDLQNGVSVNPVESTVAPANEELHNYNQAARMRASQVWKNLVSLIKREVALAMKISFEDMENYLRTHLEIFSVLIFLIASLMIRYVVFSVGLYFWGSYLLLELLILFAGVRFGEMFNGTLRFRPLLSILIAGMLPLFVAGFDQLYLNTILRVTSPLSVSLPDLCATAEWLTSPDGTSYLSTHLEITSDFFWFIAVAEMLVVFLWSRMFGKHSDKGSLATA
jgi:DNA-binding CsgD family transcriptional regulator